MELIQYVGALVAIAGFSTLAFRLGSARGFRKGAQHGLEQAEKWRLKFMWYLNIKQDMTGHW